MRPLVVPAGRQVVYVACDPGSKPPLRMLDPGTGRDRLLGPLEHFYRGSSHVNLAASEDGSMIVFKGSLRRGSDLIVIENFR